MSFPEEASDKYRAEFVEHSVPSVMRAGTRVPASVKIYNRGSSIWDSRAGRNGQTNIVVNVDGTPLTFDFPTTVAPGECANVPLFIDVPAEGKEVPIVIDIVAQNIAFFSDLGTQPLAVTAQVSTTSIIVQAGKAKRVPTYATTVIEWRAPKSVPPGAKFGIWARFRNMGLLTWNTKTVPQQQVSAVLRAEGEVVGRASLSGPTKTFDAVDVHLVAEAPVSAGRHSLKLGLVHEGVTFFEDQGVTPCAIPITVQNVPQQAGNALFSIAMRRNSAFFHPAGGLSILRDGQAMPQVLERAEGCRVWDTNGREYIDYTMGWGCALLGYSHATVEEAARSAMGCGPVLPLPHRIELELSEYLCQAIPCAEAVAFGKNGSDVCTLAIRIARAATSRTHVLCCGYHGWQDWFAESLGFAGTGVPSRDTPLISRFELNDLGSFREALQANCEQLAAVILEPSGSAGGPNGVAEDVDINFLRAVASETRNCGAILIYDEIITGFRYPTGSVQRATGIVPDLACFGKALGNGYPISALVGRQHLLSLMSRSFYGPTFKGEVYSLAAAKAALSIYHSEPVAENVWSYGQQLQCRIQAICEELKIKARVVGPPFRTGLVFTDPNSSRRDLLRTLYLQELLRGGLITYGGLMLPSFAHGPAELDATMAIVRNALTKCYEHGDNERALHRVIEMPVVKPG